MKIIILLVFLFVLLANPITGGKLFPGFNNPEKWMKRVIRKLQRKTSAYGNMIASNTAEISNTAGFISSIGKCEDNYINDPDNGLSCCFEDNSNEGQCLCNGMTIDDPSNPGSCCIANQRHPGHCLCSGTDIDDLNNPGNCCFKDENNPTQCLCNGNYTDNPNKRCFNLDWKGDGICDDQNNHAGCDFDGKDCCGEDPDTDLCTLCQCLEGETPLPNAVGCCYPDPKNTGQCLCTGKYTDDSDNAGSCCVEHPDSPGTCCIDSITCNGQGTCSSGDSGICACDSGFTGNRCNVTTCPGAPVCSDKGSCPQGGTVCECQEGFHGDDCATFCNAATTCTGNGTCEVDGSCICDAGLTGSNCNETDRGSGLILVANGLDWSSGYSADMNVFNFSEPSYQCSLPNYPFKMHAGMGGVVNGNVIVCGGNAGSDGKLKVCYKFDLTSDSWEYLADLPATTAHAGYVPYNDALWVLGGRFTDGYQSVLVHADGTVTEGPIKLPTNSDGHCMLNLLDGRIMVLGGSGNQKEVLIYDPLSNQFIIAPSMNNNRMYVISACTIFESPLYDYRPTIFIASDYTAEVYDYTTPGAIWELVDDLPTTYSSKFQGPSAVQSISGDGVYLEFERHFYELTCDTNTCSWIIRNEELPQTNGGIYSVMMHLPTGFKCRE